VLADHDNFNLDLLRQRGEEIRRAISILARHASLPQNDFVEDQTIVDAAKYRLLIAIEAAIAICTHLTARMAGKAPATYAQCFEELARSGIISQELADRLGRMARFRNLLVHVYAEVDDNRVWETLQSDLQDLESYLSAIGEAIKEQIQ
jgi:uncharacterized protein YutE (UPF0331/DUF86 family)